ncbi:DUF6065 family protein [Nioella sp.]|uniref:DUF6065 family protein n=1 Tax=Nioella sp. TaxID=1912091 RepID=UPI003514A027
MTTGTFDDDGLQDVSDRVLSDPELTAYRITSHPPEMVPADATRNWMDGTVQRFAYRCTPLSIANGTGWELLVPYAFSATWTGGRQTGDIQIKAEDPDLQGHVDSFAQSHFGEAVLTMQPGYLFRTAPGWALWVRGSPNHQAINVSPLEGIVETDWLPFTFTMNWRFSYPGTVHFRKGDRFCFLTPVPHVALSSIQPRVRDLSDDPELEESYKKWATNRTAFNDRLKAEDPETVRQGWQRHYLRGDPQGGEAPQFHLKKRRMKWPLEE